MRVLFVLLALQDPAVPEEIERVLSEILFLDPTAPLEEMPDSTLAEVLDEAGSTDDEQALLLLSLVRLSEMAELARALEDDPTADSFSERDAERTKTPASLPREPSRGRKPARSISRPKEPASSHRRNLILGGIALGIAALFLLLRRGSSP